MCIHEVEHERERKKPENLIRRSKCVYQFPACTYQLFTAFLIQMALSLLVAGAQVTIVPRGSRESSCSAAVFAVAKQKDG
jgi:hypothetical protein